MLVFPCCFTGCRRDDLWYMDLGHFWYERLVVINPAIEGKGCSVFQAMYRCGSSPTSFLQNGICFCLLSCFCFVPLASPQGSWSCGLDPLGFRAIVCHEDSILWSQFCLGCCGADAYGDGYDESWEHCTGMKRGEDMIFILVFPQDYFRAPLWRVVLLPVILSFGFFL